MEGIKQVDIGRYLSTNSLKMLTHLNKNEKVGFAMCVTMVMSSRQEISRSFLKRAIIIIIVEENETEEEM